MLSVKERLSPDLQPKVDSLGTILYNTINSKPRAGVVDRDQIVNFFGLKQGEFHEDGFYEIRGLRNPVAGNIARVGTFEGDRTLWYPAKVGDLKDMLSRAAHRIDVEFGMRAWKDLREGRAPQEAQRLLSGGRSLEGASFMYSDQKSAEALESIRLIDFGSGDGAMPLLASIFKTPAIGIEIDPELMKMAQQNKISAANAGLLGPEPEFIQGSFFDEDVLNRVLRPDKKEDIRVLYMSVKPMTWKLLRSLIPHLRSDDYLLVYRELLTLSPEYPEMKDRLEVVSEVRPIFADLGDRELNLYRVTK